MAINKRISRSRKRELKAPDEFLTFSGKLLKFAAENRQRIGIGIAVLAVLVLVGAGVQYYSFHTEKKAQEMLNQGIKKAEALRNKEGDPKDVYQSAGGDFRVLLDKYPEKKAGKIARVMLADMAYAAGEYDFAVSLYKSAHEDFKKDPVYGHLILTSLAYACEQKNDYENAAGYLKMVDVDANPELAEEVLFNLGRIHVKTNPSEKENQYYQKLLKTYPNSIYANMVREKTGSGF